MEENNVKHLAFTGLEEPSGQRGTVARLFGIQRKALADTKKSMNNVVPVSGSVDDKKSNCLKETVCSGEGVGYVHQWFLNTHNYEVVG